MARYIIRRLLISCVVLILITMFTFIIIQLAPGGPEILLDESLTEADRQALRMQLGLDQPIFVQYAKWITNMIKGDMAVVGPRPLLVRYLPRYNAHQARRHEVRPGFTGLAQVHGRNAISWEEKFDWDVKYVDNITFKGDLQIIIDTVRTVLKREGINSDTSATMEEFMGTQEKA